MIIADKTNKVQFEGNFETISVGIDQKNIAHFFRMIANLYQDPTMAVLREVGANCVDATIEAGTEKLGWELHLPSRLDGNVRFVDNGVGISHDQMIRIYSIIGASSKRGNNDLIGGFGVGKWSLCSLVNNFQAVSRFNGTKSQYFISLQSSGLPDIRLIKSEATTERNGFEVKFLCPDRKISDFNEKVEKAYRFFAIKPRVFRDGKSVSLTYNFGDVIFDGGINNFSIYKGANSPVVVMGGVGYRLPSETILENKKFEKFRGLLNCNIAIHVPIGEYSITPSREAIQLDDLTMSRIFAKLGQIVDSFVPKMQVDMDAFKGNTWEAKLKLKELRDVFTFLPDTLKLDWNGKPLTAAAMSVKDAKVNLYSTASWNKKISVDEGVKNIESNKKAFLFLDDLKIGGIGRAKQAILEKKKTDSYASWAFYILKESEKAKFIQETGWVGEFALTSSLPKVLGNGTTSVGSGKVAKGTFRQRSGRNYGIHECVEFYKPADHAKTDRFILFPTASNKVFGIHQATNVDDLIKLISRQSKTEVAALFLPTSEYNDFTDSDFDSKPIVKFEEVVKTKKFADAIQKLDSVLPWDSFVNMFRDKTNWAMRSIPFVIKDLQGSFDENHIISKAFDCIKDIVADDPKSHITRSMKAVIESVDATLFSNNKSTNEKQLSEFKDHVDKIVATYPLFSPVADDYNVSNANVKTFKKPLIDYINLVDAKN